MDPRPTNYLRQNIVFSYPEIIPVSFFFIYFFFGFLLFYVLLLVFTKIILLLLLLLLYIYFFHEIIFIFSCSGMFQDVPECSGMFRVPGFIDAQCYEVKLHVKSASFSTENGQTSRFSFF